MSNRLLNLAWDARGLTPTEKIILVRLADRANDSGHCFPGHKRIADDCGLSERTVRDTLPKIESKGHLTIIEETGRASKDKPRFSYNVHPVTPEAASAVTPENAALDTGKTALPQGKNAVPTPENAASPIITSPNLVSNHQGNLPKAPPASVSTAERITLEKELDAIVAKRKLTKDGASHDAWGPMYSATEKAELKRMKEREVEIKKLLGRVF